MASSISENISKLWAVTNVLLSTTRGERSWTILVNLVNTNPFQCSDICYICIWWLVQQGLRWTPDVGQRSDHLDYRLVQYAHDVNLTVLPLVCLMSPPRAVNGADSAARLPWPGPTRHLDGKNQDRLRLSRCWKCVVFSPINNKSLQSRWSCASRRRAACQADL